ncbi:MAG: hypothetical protein LBI48_09920 [Burkholderiaceae bacterium]|jgi:hypothetical protein|nr:hypothetical protein [Burkholderiaceae bacterium]
MKRTALILQLLALLANLTVLLAPAESVLAQAVVWFVPYQAVNTPALLLAVWFGIAVLVMLLLPLRWSGSNELFFASGFGFCLALVLGYFSFRLCMLQFAAVVAIGNLARILRSNHKEPCDGA